MTNLGVALDSRGKETKEKENTIIQVLLIIMKLLYFSLKILFIIPFLWTFSPISPP